MILLLIATLGSAQYVDWARLRQTAPTTSTSTSTTSSTSSLSPGAYMNSLMTGQPVGAPNLNSWYNMLMMGDGFDGFGDFYDFEDWFPFFGLGGGAGATSTSTGTSTGTTSTNPFHQYWMWDILNKPHATAPVNPVRLSQAMPTTTTSTTTASTNPFASLFGGFNWNSLFGMAMMEDPEDPLDQMKDYVGDFFYPYFGGMGGASTGTGTTGTTGTAQTGGLNFGAFSPYAYAFMDILNKPRQLQRPQQYGRPRAQTASASPGYGTGMPHMSMNQLYQWAAYANPESPMDEMKDLMEDYYPWVAHGASTATGTGTSATTSTASTSPFAAFGGFNPATNPFLYDILNKPRPQPTLNKAAPRTFIQPVVYPNGEVLYYPIKPVNKRLRQL